MSLQVEKLEKNTAKLTVEVPAEQFAAAIQNAYKKNKGRFNIPGFRKGKAPFEMIKKMYGKRSQDRSPLLPSDMWHQSLH